jgi:hypothetical protein
MGPSFGVSVVEVESAVVTFFGQQRSVLRCNNNNNKTPSQNQRLEKFIQLSSPALPRPLLPGFWHFFFVALRQLSHLLTPARLLAMATTSDFALETQIPAMESRS